MQWTAAAVAESVGGTLRGPDVVVDTVTQDTREITPEGRYLFVPIVADRDGHDFIAAAAEAGAVAYLTARVDDSLVVPARGLAVIEVADTGVALSALGRAARDRLGSATVIGVTGSVGKTTTKDFLASVLGTGLRVHANERSFNNEIGVPLNLLAAPTDAEAVVVEMGSRGVGHVGALCEIARPSVGVITTVGTAHTSEFGDIESVARAKAELVESLPADGLAVLNADVATVAAMGGRTEASVVTYGLAEGADVRAINVSLDDNLVPSFRLVTAYGAASVRLGARGVHLIGNALAAATVGLHLGLSLDQVVDGLAAPVLSPLRMELLHLDRGVTVLNDCYNANPMSTEAALRSLAALPADNRIAVLGVMAELGARSEAEHARIGEIAAELDIRVIAVGTPAYGGRQVADIAEAAELTRKATESSTDRTAILVKGSRVAGLEQLVGLLAERT